MDLVPVVSADAAHERADRDKPENCENRNVSSPLVPPAPMGDDGECGDDAEARQHGADRHNRQLVIVMVEVPAAHNDEIRDKTSEAERFCQVTTANGGNSADHHEQGAERPHDVLDDPSPYLEGI